MEFNTYKNTKAAYTLVYAAFVMSMFRSLRYIEFADYGKY